VGVRINFFTIKIARIMKQKYFSKCILNQISLRFLIVLFLPNSLFAQSLYINGSLKTGTVSKSGVTAAAGYEWSELQNNAGDTLVSNTNSGFSSHLSSGNYLADDFIVPVGQVWTISKFSFYAYQTNAPAFPSPFSSLSIRVWNGKPEDPGSTVIFGDIITNRLNSSTNANIIRLFNSKYPSPGSAVGTTRFIWKNTANVSLNLSAGTYWIEWTFETTNNSNLFCPTNTDIGQRLSSPAANARQNNNNVWVDVLDTGNPNTVPYLKQDFPFELDGISVNIFQNFDINNGKINTRFNENNDYATAIALRAGNKPILIGNVTNAVSGTSGPDIGLIAYNANGSQDATFGLNGIKSFSAGSFDKANAVAVQSNGKIVVAGASEGELALLRYNSDGTLDNAFGVLGLSTLGIGGYEIEATSIVIQTDGKIVATGLKYDFFYGDYYAILARFNANGTLDNTFNAGASWVDLPISTGYVGKSLALQPDGKFVIACSNLNVPGNFLIVRCNANGSMDNTFDTDGIVNTNVGTATSFANSLALQPDGKIVVCGAAKDNAFDVMAMCRYNTNGSLDNTFDGDGKVITNLSPVHAIANAISIQPDGKIYLTGNTINTTNADMVVTKYTTFGALDPSFDYDGKLILPFGNGNDGSNAIVSNTNGEAYIAGYYHNGHDNDFALVKIVDCKQYVNIELQNPSDNYPNAALPNPIYGKAITATNLINTTASVSYKSTSSISLNPGFKANNGTVFKAEVGGCAY
jgi:uncharacterized delta-60 repeat protein